MEPNGNNTFPSSTAPMPTLFGAFDKCIAIATRQMVAHVISSFREIDTKTIDPVSLKKLIREDLESFVGQLLGIFDNVGSVLPEDTLGFKITLADTNHDIRNQSLEDYWDLWLQYLDTLPKRQS